jgi:hypothetical protein
MQPENAGKGPRTHSLPVRAELGERHLWQRGCLYSTAPVRLAVREDARAAPARREPA